MDPTRGRRGSRDLGSTSTRTRGKPSAPPLLESSRGTRRRRSSRSRRRRRIVLFTLLGVGIVVLAAGAVLADAYWQSYKIYKEVKGVQPDLTTARSFLARGQLPSGDPFGAAATVAAKAQGEVEGARFTFRLVGAIPFFDRPIKAVRLGVDAANQEAQAAITLRDMVKDLLGPAALAGQGAAENSRQEAPVFRNGLVDVGLIQSLQGRLESVIQHLQAGDRDIRAIPSIPFIHRIDSLKSDALQQSSQAITLAQGALSGVKLLPSFLGADRPKTYFLALQNNADQRATGGAVLAYGILTIYRGKLSLASGGSIYDIDSLLGFKANLPSGLTWYLQHVPKTYPRIANINFSPDFPLVAQGWSSLIDAAVQLRPDGIIAVDPIALAQILGKRQIRVPSYPAPITGGNLVRVIENEQYRLPKEAQFQFPNQIIGAAWKILSDPRPFVRTIKAFQLALSQKNIQIWSADRDLQALVAKLGWDGALRVNPGDYLYVAEDKLLAGKVDFYTHTKIDDAVTVAPTGTLTSAVQIQLINQTPPGEPRAITGPNQYALNKALMVLYVPGRAQLQSALPPHGPPPHDEGPARVFVRTVSSTPGHPGVVGFTYGVPGAIVSTSQGKMYQLTIQHQPLVNPAEVTVTVTLPRGSAVRSMDPGWTVKGNVATFHAFLVKDLVTRIFF